MLIPLLRFVSVYNQYIEDTSHFLFTCSRFANHRANLAVMAIVILRKNNMNHLGNQLELYLYGHRSLDLIDNRKIHHVTFFDYNVSG